MIKTGHITGEGTPRLVGYIAW